MFSDASIPSPNKSADRFEELAALFLLAEVAGELMAVLFLEVLGLDDMGFGRGAGTGTEESGGLTGTGVLLDLEASFFLRLAFSASSSNSLSQLT